MDLPPASSAAPADFKTILSIVQEIASNDALSERIHPLHPYSSDPETVISVLRTVIDATNDISASLNAQIAIPFADPKTLSLLRQQTQINHTVHNANQTIRQTVEALRKRAGILYGEDIPLERTVLVDWLIKKLESWGNGAGMEVFKEDENNGKITVMLGGKVMVVDVNVAVDRSLPDKPTMRISNIKTSYAIPNQPQGTTTNGSISLDGFLLDSLQTFLDQIQRDAELQDTEETARLASHIADDLNYLMMLDQLALREGDEALRWFTQMDLLSVHAEEVASKEAEVVAKSLSLPSAPLDIFLMRAHALPLPYIAIPSMSFLVYLSPLAYLTLLRTHPTTLDTSPLSKPFLPVLDIPFKHLRPQIAAHPRLSGSTLATLVLATEGPILPPQSTIEVFATRPTFELHSAGMMTDLVFPMPLDAQGTAGRAHRWFLDFTDGGTCPGVVMSQARMREIETIVDPLGAGITQDDSVPMDFGSTSWVDLLLVPEVQISPERYTSLYESPSSAHPPLQLRLAAPEEPGFFLEKIPVKTLKEIWGILEIVREQCWLNEIICSTQWVPDALLEEEQADGVGEQAATEDELQAVLEGTNAPSKIPVNIYLPTHVPAPATEDEPLFDPADIDIGMGLGAPHTDRRATKIVLRAPEPPPGFGMFEIAVEYDAMRPRGIALKVEGALGADLDIDKAEEVCRRGGLLGLPGRVWAKLHGRA